MAEPNVIRALQVPATETGRTCLSDFSRLIKIGEGTFGEIWKYQEKKTKKIVAIKILNVKEVQSMPGLHKQIKREIEIQGQLRHRNILRMQGSFRDTNRIYIVLDFVTLQPERSQSQTKSMSCNMYQVLKRQPYGRFNERQAADYMSQLVDGLLYCHNRGVMHRDIKLENILLNPDGVVVICDFGFSARESPGKRRDTYCGTPLYLSPEMITGESEHDKRTDIWSLGVVLFELLYGKNPFEDPNDDTLETLNDRILRGVYRFPRILRSEGLPVSSNAQNLISSLLKQTPDERIPLKDVFEHQWMKDNLPDEKREKLYFYQNQEEEQ